MSQHRLPCALLAATLFLLPNSDSGARAPAQRNLDATLKQAVSFCEAASTRAAGAGFPMPIGGGVSIHDGAPPAAGVPDLVKRFADSQPMGRMSSSRFYLHFAASNGQVWAVVYDGMPACSVMVTGTAEDMPAAAARLADTLPKAGWRIAGFKPATATMPLAKHILTRKVAKPGTPNFGIMLSLRALSGNSADATGVQLEMRFLAGEVVSSPGSPDVEVKMDFSPGKSGTSSPDPK